MICKKCKTDNLDNVTYCRECGAQLKELTVAEKYPDYNFVPSSVKLAGKSPKGDKVAGFSVLAVWLFLGGLVCVFSWNMDFPGDLPLFLTLLSPILFLLGVLCFKKARYYDKFTYTSLFEWIEDQPKKNPYAVVVKSGKFGVFNLNTNKFQIPCEYDCISWQSIKGVLTVTKDSEVYDLDIFGNKLS